MTDLGNDELHTAIAEAIAVGVGAVVRWVVSSTGAIVAAVHIRITTEGVVERRAVVAIGHPIVIVVEIANVALAIAVSVETVVGDVVAAV